MKRQGGPKWIVGVAIAFGVIFAVAVIFWLLLPTEHSGSPIRLTVRPSWVFNGGAQVTARNEGSTTYVYTSRQHLTGSTFHATGVLAPGQEYRSRFDTTPHGQGGLPVLRSEIIRRGNSQVRTWLFDFGNSTLIIK